MELAKYLIIQKTGLVRTVRKSGIFLLANINEKKFQTATKFIYHDDFTIVRHNDKLGKYVIFLNLQHQT